MIHPILTHPDSVLRQVSTPVGASDDAARRLLDDMLETMYGAQGRGLAAIQIGVPKRAVVIDVAWKEGAPQPLFLLDPEIVWVSEAQATMEERCLSIPDTPRTVERPAHVLVRYRDRNGVERIDDMSGMLAVVVQHEIDHLNGALILDYAAPDTTNR